MTKEKKNSKNCEPIFYNFNFKLNEKTTQILTEGTFYAPVSKAIEILLNQGYSKDFYYVWVDNYRTTFSESNMNLPDNKNYGVDHGDELYCVFPIPGEHQSLIK